MIKALSSQTAFARRVADILGDASFTLIDIGCSGGIDEAWSAFGSHLRAFAFDPDIAEVRRLATQETNHNVEYIARFVGLSADDPGYARMRHKEFWANNPWLRLSVTRTQEIQTAKRKPFIGESGLDVPSRQLNVADASNPIIIQDFLRDRLIDDVDFIKLDVDGPDFLILRSLASVLDEKNVLGVAAEVNFFGTDDAHIHTFHNTDRLMREHGFELFSLDTRSYSVQALPSPYEFAGPGSTLWGRTTQGDAIYLKDLAAAGNLTSALTARPDKLLKLAALFSLSGLPDCAAEVLIAFRTVIGAKMDVALGLDTLTEQCRGDAGGAASYAGYMSEFENDADYFYPARTPR